MEGKVKLPLLKKPPPLIDELLDPLGSQRSKMFRTQIRTYNAMFAMTSMGGKVDSRINDGRHPYIFKLNDQNHHRIGTLLPNDGQDPQFAQLYFYDTENEVENRMNIFSNGEIDSDLDPCIVDALVQMFDETNTLVKIFRMSRDRFFDTDVHHLRLRLIGSRTTDGREYNLPTCSEIAAIIIGDIGAENAHRDIIAELKEGGLQRINVLHPSYMALQYPLLFPYGEDGFRLGILYSNVDGIRSDTTDSVTMREYYAYRLQEREHEGHTLVNGGRLFQQFVVDAYTCIEEIRLMWVKENQDKLRIELYKGLKDAVMRGDTTPASSGKRFVLPSSFTGSPSNNEDETLIEIPHDLLIQPGAHPFNDIVKVAYPDFDTKFNDYKYLEERVILAPTNEVVEDINGYMIDLINADEETYLSADSLCKASSNILDQDIFKMSMEYTTLKQISRDKDNSKLKVRVLRMWDAINIANNHDLISLDMILVEKEGTLIHASIRKNLAQSFRPQLNEGSIYTITNFLVEENKGNYRPVHNQLKILFNSTTSVSKFNGFDHSIPQSQFEFSDYGTIASRCYDNTYLTAIEEIKTRGRPTKMRNIQLLLEESKSIRTTLWGNTTQQIDDDFYKTNKGPFIVIVTSTIVKTFRGEYQLSSTFATKLYINLDIPEVAEIRNIYTTMDITVKDILSKELPKAQDGELALHNRKTVAEIKDLEWNSKTKDLLVTCNAKIININNKYGWYYFACLICKTKVKQVKGVLWCERCKNQPKFAIPRIQVQVQDETGSTTFILFDKGAEKIISKTAKELAEMQEEIFKLDGNTIPNEIQKIIGNEYLFQLHLDEYNLKYGKENYTVSKILEMEISHKQNDSRKVEEHQVIKAYLLHLTYYMIQTLVYS
ncbi:hypothetical protein CMV_017305 [Castanea mollissima]|uniref:ATP-dependent DNA helicase n=1 Tax=Castanea mollissima TaxID=60419 RepID=A0A8J4QSV3_9ROSI|nr:hypothetical protein CMV_017305 [Castanea mollissima]